MADKKLSELTELATTPANDDEVYIRDLSEEAAAESKRITVLNFLGGLVAHIAATVVHGAVSAATASKIVIRDASARAKFAAPGAAGDAIIADANLRAPDSTKLEGSSKATVQDHTPKAHTLASHSDTGATGAELEELTGGGETDLHSHAGGGDGKSIATGTYTGDGSDDRQITVGFKCSLVILQKDGTYPAEWDLLPNITIEHCSKTDYHIEQVSNVSLHATDGFIVSSTGAGGENPNFGTLYYWAISE